MARRAVFEGLVVDGADHPVSVTYLGGVPHYVVDDAGFLRHIPSENVDRQVLAAMQEGVLENRDMVVEGLLQYMGKDDLFTKAAVEASMGQLGEQFDRLLEVGLPEEARSWMGLMGFRVVIDIHGDVVDLEMPGAIAPDE